MIRLANILSLSLFVRVKYPPDLLYNHSSFLFFAITRSANSFAPTLAYACAFLLTKSINFCGSEDSNPRFSSSFTTAYAASDLVPYFIISLFLIAPDAPSYAALAALPIASIGLPIPLTAISPVLPRIFCIVGLAKPARPNPPIPV